MGSRASSPDLQEGRYRTSNHSRGAVGASDPSEFGIHIKLDICIDELCARATSLKVMISLEINYDSKWRLR